jgi:DNA-binding transcriptional LysR family regulator
MDLLALTDFNLVARHGGIGRASRASGTPKATLSRRVMLLEESLGIRLLERGARSLMLTPAGARLFARTEGLLREVAEVGATIGAGSHAPHGALRVSAPVLLAHVALGRVAAGFARAYPAVRLEITAEDRAVDPVEEGYDVVIRINPAPDDRLVGRCFLNDEVVVVAPPSIARPVCAGDEPALVPAVLPSAAPPGTIWQIPHGERTDRFLAEPVLRLSSLLMVRDAVLAGAGAGLLPRFLVVDDVAAGRLACWGAVADRPVAIWALHPSRRLVSSKVTAFMQTLAEAFPQRVL